MIDDQLRAAIAAADARDHAKGAPVWMNPRLDIEDPTPPVAATPQPKVPSGKPEPIAEPGPRQEPTGGGTGIREHFDPNVIVDRVQGDIPSTAGYRDTPAVMNTRR